MNLFMHGVVSFFAVASLSMIFCVPRRFLAHSGFSGALGWVIYIGLERTESNEMVNMFLAAFAVALVSHIFARIFKAPVTVFLIAGILPLVPGVGVYRIAYYMMQESSTLGGYYFVYSLQMSGMIAIALLFVDTIFKITGRWNSVRKKEKK